MRLLWIFLFFPILLYGGITVDSDKPINLLSGSQMYLDSTGQMSVEELIAHPEKFQPLDEPFLNYGYILGQSVWIKFTLVNKGDTTLQRSVFIGNTLMDRFELFMLEEKTAKHLGTLGTIQRQTFEGIINFSFPVILLPKSETTYFFRTYAASAATWFKLELTTPEEAIKRDVTRQVILGLFFGGMLALVLYNFFLLFFTKESIYLFYILYLISLIANHETMTGLILYWLPLENREFMEAEAFFGVHYINFISFTMSVLNFRT